MSDFRVGTFKRDAMGSLLRHLSPSSASLSLYEIDPAELAAMGKKLVLIDVDNTLVGWRGEEIPQESRDWIGSAKANGLGVCILSNTRNPSRLERIAGQLDVKFLRGKFKPSREMYRQAISDFGVTESEAVMIGDQLFTDVLGANRSGIDAIWVRPMTGRDFIGTKFSRMGERFARRALYRHLESTEVLHPGDAATLAPSGLLQHPVVRQFMKFVIVGATSTIIDLGLHALLMFYVQVDGRQLGVVFGQWLIDTMPGAFSFAKNPHAAAYPLLKIPTAGLAILNGFYWNRRWTFQITSKEERFKQLQKFVLVSLVGMGLSTVIGGLLNNIVPGHPKRSWAVASAVSTVLVAFWNFTGQKYFAFRQKSHEPDL